MPNIGLVLKEEICRLARKEAKPELRELHGGNATLRRWVADLKRRVASLEKENRALSSRLNRLGGSVPEAAPQELEKARISARSIRILRKKFRLSQAEFARLVGVSMNCVYVWEQKEGRLGLRAQTRAAVLAVRKIGVREARARLEKMKEKEKKAKRKGKRGKRGR